MKGRVCHASADKTRLFGPRCGNTATHETLLGFFCDACFEYLKANYEGSLLKMLRDVRQKT